MQIYLIATFILEIWATLLGVASQGEQVEPK